MTKTISNFFSDPKKISLSFDQGYSSLYAVRNDIGYLFKNSGKENVPFLIMLAIFTGFDILCRLRYRIPLRTNSLNQAEEETMVKRKDFTKLLKDHSNLRVGVKQSRETLLKETQYFKVLGSIRNTMVHGYNLCGIRGFRTDKRFTKNRNIKISVRGINPVFKWNVVFSVLQGNGDSYLVNIENLGDLFESYCLKVEKFIEGSPIHAKYLRDNWSLFIIKSKK